MSTIATLLASKRKGHDILTFSPPQLTQQYRSLTIADISSIASWKSHIHGSFHFLVLECSNAESVQATFWTCFCTLHLSCTTAPPTSSHMLAFWTSPGTFYYYYSPCNSSALWQTRQNASFDPELSPTPPPREPITYFHISDHMLAERVFFFPFICRLCENKGAFEHIQTAFPSSLSINSQSQCVRDFRPEMSESQKESQFLGK